MHIEGCLCMHSCMYVTPVKDYISKYLDLHASLANASILLKVPHACAWSYSLYFLYKTYINDYNNIL